MLTRNLCALALLSLSAIACSSNKMDADPFATLQACFDEHHSTESLPIKESIVVCCTDHPIAGVHPSCLSTVADCVTHVTAELSASISSNAVTAADVQTACMDYIAKK